MGKGKGKELDPREELQGLREIRDDLIARLEITLTLIEHYREEVEMLENTKPRRKNRKNA